MKDTQRNIVTIAGIVRAPIEKVWKYYTEPKHITQWSFASDDWEASAATNDVRNGGKFSTTMRSKDGSESFDFTGSYTDVKENEFLMYTLDDGRNVTVAFTPQEDNTKIVITFEPENENPLDMQRLGWQAILNNFKKYTEEK